MPSRNGNVTARCGVCGARLVGSRSSRRWCSDACRQAAFRRLHQPATPAAPALPASRSLREGTVYECPDCQTRQIGAQRCEDCGIFMRRVGAGGRCPHCEEPVAVEEITS